jgi:hypothetical protein
VILRGYRPGDQGHLYRICLQTGDHGTDATAQFRDPDLLGHVYAAPYGKGQGFGHATGAAELVRNRVAAAISQVPWRITGQTNLVSRWKL